MRPSNSGGCQANQLTNTGAVCFDLASASVITLCRLLLTSDQISAGLLSGYAFAYASTTSCALSPSPGPNPARCFRRSATCASVRLSADASGQAGDISFNVEQMIIGTLAAVAAASGT